MLRNRQIQKTDATLERLLLNFEFERIIIKNLTMGGLTLPHSRVSYQRRRTSVF